VFSLGTLALGAAGSAQEIIGHPDAGANVFKKCIACHRIGANAKNAVGPELNGVIGRVAGSVEGYDYSDELKKSGITWDKEKLIQWVMSPKVVVPGTKMTFAGLNEQDAADVVAYLAQYDAAGNMVPGQ
jgi:cytochrome c